MKYLIFGVGAIGTYIGGSLLKARKDVSFIERPEALPELQKTGISLTIGENFFQESHPVLHASPDEAFKDKIDVVIFAMKSFDTRSVVESLIPYLDRFGVVLCLQNGVENESVIAESTGWEKVIGGTVTSAVGRSRLGQVTLERKRGIGILDRAPISRQIYRDFADAELAPRLFSVLEDMKWSKMISNLLGNASCAILDMTPAQVFANPDLYRMEMEQVREALRVMKANGWKAVDLPGVPMKALTTLIGAIPDQLTQPLLKGKLGGGRGAKMPSFHIDLHSGKKQSEVVFLNGAVSRFGKQANIKTPVNTVFNNTLLDLVNDPGLIPEFRSNPAKLLAEIRKTEKFLEA